MENHEIDALVAEKIMGWKDTHLSPRHYTGNRYWGINTEGKKDIVPTYSENMQQAWQVVEKMGGFVQLTHENDKWYCGFTVVDSVDAPTPTEAICKAALLAKGVEFE